MNRALRVAVLLVPAGVALWGVLRLDWPAYPVVVLFWFESVVAVVVTALCLRRRRRAQDGGSARLHRLDSRWVIAMLGCCAVLGLFIFGALGGEWVSLGENRWDIVQWDPLRYLESGPFAIGVLGVLGGRAALYLRERSTSAAHSANTIAAGPTTRIFVLVVAVFIALAASDSAGEARTGLAVELVLGMAVVDVLLALGVAPLRLPLDD